MVALSSRPLFAKAADGNDFTDRIFEYADGLDLSSFQSEYEKYSGYFGESDLLAAVKRYISGDLNVGYEQMISAALKGFKDVFGARLKDLVAVIFIAVFSAIVNALGGERSGGVIKLCDFLFSSLIIVFLSSLFISYYKGVKSVIGDFSAIIQGAFPVILTLFSTIGAGGGAFSPAVGFLGGLFSWIITAILLPLILCVFVFSLVGNLSERIKLGKFGELFKSAFKWIIGVMSLVFCFTLSAQSVVASAFDGLSFKAIKFAFSNGVPIVSQMVQGGFDVVFSSLILIKNSVGLIAMILLLIALIAPVIELAATILVIRFIAACVEPLGAVFANKTLSVCADCFSLFCAVIICAGICFALTIFLMIISLGGAV